MRAWPVVCVCVVRALKKQGVNSPFLVCSRASFLPYIQRIWPVVCVCSACVEKAWRKQSSPGLFQGDLLALHTAHMARCVCVCVCALKKHGVNSPVLVCFRASFLLCINEHEKGCACML